MCNTANRTALRDRGPITPGVAPPVCVCRTAGCALTPWGHRRLLSAGGGGPAIPGGRGVRECSGEHGCHGTRMQEACASAKVRFQDCSCAGQMIYLRGGLVGGGGPP